MALQDEVPRAVGWKNAIQRVARLAGLHIGRFPPVDSLGYHLKTVFRELAIDHVLDVGAHQGEFATSLRDIGYTGKIISFEPVAASFAKLREVCGGDQHWRGINIALGREDGELEMNIYSGSVFNSFLKIAEESSPRFPDGTKLVRVDKVPIRRLEGVLDDLFAHEPRARVFLKMDTQGYDLEVLRGAGKHIPSIQGLLTELAVRSTYVGMPNLPQALVELEHMGFALTGLFPVARELDHLRLIELDCVMCRVPG